MSKRFRHISVTDEDVQKRIEVVADQFIALGQLLDSVCPPSRSLSVAMTHLETSKMWAVQAISHGE